MNDKPNSGDQFRDVVDVVATQDKDGKLRLDDGAETTLDAMMAAATHGANLRCDEGAPIVVSWWRFKWHFAGWAVCQSPYDVPYDLERVLAAVFARVKPIFHEGDEWAQKYGARSISRRELRERVEAAILGTPEIQPWNDRRNGRDGPGFRTAFGEPDPDDDFVDLHALSRNVVVSLIREADEQAAWNADFDRRHGKGKQEAE